MNKGLKEDDRALDAHARIIAVQSALQSHLIGHAPLIERLLIALLTGGHLLLEGAPGLAKTKTIKTFASLLQTDFVRVQATPDLLPADITGTDVYHQPSGEFRFISGPLFNNVILFDEINRAPPKVQSALLEAMGERQITTGGITRTLDKPFLVAATQNPIEHEGTYPLPEAQLDRFMFFCNVQMPTTEKEREILDQVLLEDHAKPLEKHTSCRPDDVALASTELHKVHISDAVRDYIVRLTGATRGEGHAGSVATHIAHPSSPRGSIFLAQAARARAWLHGADFVTPDDVTALASDVLSGRITLNYQARANGVTARALLEQLLDNTPRT